MEIVCVRWGLRCHLHGHTLMHWCCWCCSFINWTVRPFSQAEVWSGSRRRFPSHALVLCPFNLSPSIFQGTQCHVTHTHAHFRGHAALKLALLTVQECGGINTRVHAHSSIGLPNSQQERQADGGRQACGRSLSVTERNRIRLSLSPYLSGPPRVALPRCVTPEHTHTPYTFALPPAVPYCKCVCRGWGDVLQACDCVSLFVHPRIGGVSFHVHSVVFVDICHIACVTAYLCGCMQRESDKSRTVEYVCVYVVGTTQERRLKQLKTWWCDTLKRHQTQSWSGGAELIHVDQTGNIIIRCIRRHFNCPTENKKFQFRKAFRHKWP